MREKLKKLKQKTHCSYLEFNFNYWLMFAGFIFSLTQFNPK